MKPTFSIAAPLMALCLISLGGCLFSTLSANETNPKYSMKNEFTEGFIKLPEHPTVSVCSIEITVGNISDRSLYFTLTPRAPACEVTLVDPEGKQCGLTDAGKKHFASAATPSVGHSFLVWLEKGRPKSCEMDLAKYFKLTPGKWNFSLVLYINEENATRPNTIPYVEFKNLELDISK